MEVFQSKTNEKMPTHESIAIAVAVAVAVARMEETRVPQRRFDKNGNGIARVSLKRRPGVIERSNAARR